MDVILFSGDLVDAPAEALCTSTNANLTLVMGTGASVRERGGFAILRECEAILEQESRRTGRKHLPPGSVHATSAGSLAARVVLHCVASDQSHRSSPDIVRACAARAMLEADRRGCRSIAMPLFGTGHAQVAFDQSLTAIAEAVRDADTKVERVYFVTLARERIDEVLSLVARILPGLGVSVAYSDAGDR